jgi:transcriptional regulator with XRE-family HTH domain
LIPFSKILVAKGLLRPYKAWCPVCYQQWKQNQQVIYDPLIWSLTDVKTCLIHHIPLVQNCPHCNHQLLWLDWKSVLGYCPQCYNWLGGDYKSLGTTQERWKIETVGELLANSNQLSSVLTQEHIQKSFHYAVNRVNDGNMAAFAKMNGIPKNTFWGWYSGKNLPSLSTLLQICYNLNISLSQFLTQDFNLTVNQSQNLKIETELPKNKRLSPRNLDLSHVEHTLTLILSQDSESILTIKEIAEQLQVNRRALSRYFPELCQKIVAKRRNYRHICHLFMIDQCCQEIKEAIASLHQLGEHPTESRVCELINNPGYLRYKKVRLHYKQEVQSLLSRL